MSTTEPKLLSSLLGDSEAFPLEARVLSAAILTSALICSLFVISSLVLGAPLRESALAGIGALVFWGLYGLGRKKERPPGLIWAYLAFNYLVLAVDWLFVGGRASVALLTAVVLTGAIPLVTSGNQLRAGLTSLLGFYLFLAVSLIFFSDSIPTPPETLTGNIQLALEVAILCLGLGAVTYLGVSSYRRQKAEVQELNLVLEHRNLELEKALQEVKTLQGILPICSFCKKIRDDQGYWNQVEVYVRDRSEADFSHSVCPDCMARHYPEVAGRRKPTRPE